ncbi:MAG: hypothetical protein IT437_09315 [Phycisphaerales bacterium]|nr:hypothetical protein [Phycisphaerales bacterium]
MLLPLLLALHADPQPARAEIEAALANMTRAVLAADQPAFLASIDQSEPEFATEWRHWAAQLRDWKPDAFAMTIGEGDATFGDTRAVVPLRMTWTINKGPEESWGAGGKPRDVAFPPVVFLREDPDGDGPLPARWLLHGEDWTEIRGQGFIVRYIPGGNAEKVARDVLAAFPVAREHDNAFFGLDPGPQILKLYTSMDHLKATVYLNMPDSYLGGWSESGESIKFLTSYAHSIPEWKNAYAHEYGHVCTWAMGPQASAIPWWTSEGIAEQAAAVFRPGYTEQLDKRFRNLARAGELTPWEDITDYVTAKQKVKAMAYLQGNSLMLYVTGHWGDAERNGWVRAMCRGATPDAATREVLGLPFADLDRDWRASLATPAGEK